MSALRYLQLHRARITTTAQNLRYIASQLSAFICQPEAYLPDVYNTLERCFGLPKASIEDAITLALGKVDSVAEMFEMENPLTAVGGLARRPARTVDPASDQGKYIGIILSEAARLEAALNGIAQAVHLLEMERK